MFSLAITWPHIHLNCVFVLNAFQEYIPGADSDAQAGGPTTVVVSVVLEIQGDSTK